jgi:hypothetical protein
MAAMYDIVPGCFAILVMMIELQMGQVIRIGVDPNCGVV